MFSGTLPETGIVFLRLSALFEFIRSEKKKLKNNNIHRFFKKLLHYFTLLILMGNGAIGNGGKVKQFFKDFGEGVKDGLNTVVDFGKKVINTPGVTDLINMGTSALGVPVNVGGMISSGLDVTSNLLGGGSQKRDILKDILKDPNKYDFMSGVDQISSLIKWKATPIWKK
jgi:hypothetical protein